jgi:hypothetical protein
MILAPQFKEDLIDVTEIDKKYNGNWLKLINNYQDCQWEY